MVGEQWCRQARGARLEWRAHGPWRDAHGPSRCTTSTILTSNTSFSLQYGIAMATGALFVHFWTKKYPASAELYAYAVAAGFVAGEGIAGVINAILQIAGVPPGTYGSTVGIPPWQQ